MLAGASAGFQSSGSRAMRQDGGPSRTVGDSGHKANERMRPDSDQVVAWSHAPDDGFIQRLAGRRAEVVAPCAQEDGHQQAPSGGDALLTRARCRSASPSSVGLATSPGHVNFRSSASILMTVFMVATV